MVRHILVIEDDESSAQLLVYLLRAFGHRTTVAHDGADALAKAEREPPDLILCDILLPGIDGFGVARGIRAHEKLRGVPLVAVTAYAMVGDRERILAAGFDGYIPKPIVPETFVRQIENLLALET